MALTGVSSLPFTIRSAVLPALLIVDRHVILFPVDINSRLNLLWN